MRLIAIHGVLRIESHTLCTRNLKIMNCVYTICIYMYMWVLLWCTCIYMYYVGGDQTAVVRVQVTGKGACLSQTESELRYTERHVYMYLTFTLRLPILQQRWNRKWDTHTWWSLSLGITASISCLHATQWVSYTSGMLPFSLLVQIRPNATQCKSLAQCLDKHVLSL